MEDVKLVYCRLCGIKCKKSVKIFSRKGRGMGLQDKILKCFMFSVNKKDQLPTKICYTCIDRLDDFNQFTLLVRQAQTKLRMLLKSSGAHLKEERNSELISTWKAILALQEREMMCGSRKKRKRKDVILDNSDNSSESLSSDSSSNSDSHSEVESQTPKIKKTGKANMSDHDVRRKREENVSTSTENCTTDQPRIQENSSISSTYVTPTRISSSLPNQSFTEKSRLPEENSSNAAPLPSQPFIITSQMPNPMFVIQGTSLNSVNRGIPPLYFLSSPSLTNLSQLSSEKKKRPLLPAPSEESTSNSVNLTESLALDQSMNQNSSTPSRSSVSHSNTTSSSASCPSVSNTSGKSSGDKDSLVQSLVSSARASLFPSKKLKNTIATEVPGDFLSNDIGDLSGETLLPKLLSTEDSSIIHKTDQLLVSGASSSGNASDPERNKKDICCSEISTVDIPTVLADKVLSPESVPAVKFKIVQGTTTKNGKTPVNFGIDSKSRKIRKKRSSADFLPNDYSDISSFEDDVNVGATEVSSDSHFSDLPPLVLHEDAVREMSTVTSNYGGAATSSNITIKCWQNNSLQEGEMIPFSNPGINYESVKEESTVFDQSSLIEDEAVKLINGEKTPILNAKKISKKDAFCSADLDDNIEENLLGTEPLESKASTSLASDGQSDIMIKCRLCSSESAPAFSSMVSALRHHSESHPGKSSMFSCTKCGFITGDSQDIQNHIQRNCLPSFVPELKIRDNVTQKENVIPRVKLESTDDFRQALNNLKNALSMVGLPRFRKLLTTCKAVVESEEKTKSPDESNSLPSTSNADNSRSDSAGGSLYAHRGSGWKCAFCPTSFRLEIELQEHVKRHHRNSNGTRKSAQGKKCKPMNDYPFSRKGSKYKCRQCCMEFSSMYKVKMHAMRNHRKTFSADLSSVNCRPSGSNRGSGPSSASHDKVKVELNGPTVVERSEVRCSSAARNLNFNEMVFDIPAIKKEPVDPLPNEDISLDCCDKSITALNSAQGQQEVSDSNPEILEEIRPLKDSERKIDVKSLEKPPSSKKCESGSESRKSKKILKGDGRVYHKYGSNDCSNLRDKTDEVEVQKERDGVSSPHDRSHMAIKSISKMLMEVKKVKLCKSPSLSTKFIDGSHQEDTRSKGKKVKSESKKGAVDNCSGDYVSSSKTVDNDRSVLNSDSPAVSEKTCAKNVSPNSNIFVQTIKSPVSLSPFLTNSSINASKITSSSKRYLEEAGSSLDPDPQTPNVKTSEVVRLNKKFKRKIGSPIDPVSLMENVKANEDVMPTTKSLKEAGKFLSPVLTNPTARANDEIIIPSKKIKKEIGSSLDPISTVGDLKGNDVIISNEKSLEEADNPLDSIRPLPTVSSEVTSSSKKCKKECDNSLESKSPIEDSKIVAGSSRNKKHRKDSGSSVDSTPSKDKIKTNEDNTSRKTNLKEADSSHDSVDTPSTFKGSEVCTPNKRWLKEAGNYCSTRSLAADCHRGLVLKVPLVKVHRLKLKYNKELQKSDTSEDHDESSLHKKKILLE